MDKTELLAFTAQQNASDLHLSAGLPPMIRVDGDIRRIDVPRWIMRPAESENDVRLAIKLDSPSRGSDGRSRLDVETSEGNYIDKWWLHC
jgi:Tfp pilus assembly pilus retraction ATPase PilT